MWARVASLIHRDPSAFAFSVLRLKAFAITPS